MIDTTQRQKEVEELKKTSKDNLIARGVAFEEMTRTQGFEFLKQYFATAVNVFANSIIQGVYKTKEEIEFERGKIVGMQNILNDIESALQTLYNERRKPTEETTTTPTI